MQKIRTVELDGKVIKLQIVSSNQILLGCRAWSESLQKGMPSACNVLQSSLSLTGEMRCAVGHGRPRALSHYHQQLLPRSPWHHCECSGYCALSSDAACTLHAPCLSKV